MPSLAEKLAANASPKCCICTKSVFKPEEVRSIGKIWHKTCFTCGATGKGAEGAGKGCGKTLSIMEGYQVHEERVPHCKNCFNKLCVYVPVCRLSILV